MKTWKAVAVLGSTGSIGVSTLDVCRRHPEMFRVVALAGGGNVAKLAEQACEFRPRLVSVRSTADAARMRALVPDETAVACGEEGAVAAATLPEADVVVSAIVGAAGLVPTLRAVTAGKTVALANKESLVIAGELLTGAASRSGSRIIPVDSEHSAVFQCLNGEHPSDVARLILTASGGPFWETPRERFPALTRVEALRHPNWAMGAKITVDSATMMNKGLEVIEARHLFGVPVDKISVVVHPQSVIHSLVEFVDGSVMAQLGEPDMRVPIAYALSHPRRVPTGARGLSLTERGRFTFFEPDPERFPALELARAAVSAGGTSPAVLNAANEIAVELFLKDRVRFTDIPDIVEGALGAHRVTKVFGIEDILAADAWAREKATEIAARRSRISLAV